MDGDESRGDGAQHRQRHGPRVDAGAAPAVGRQRAGEEQLAVLRLDAVFRQRGERRLADVEHALDKRPLLAGADEVAVAARAAEQQQRVEDDALARAGLAGKDVEAVPERQVQPLDDGDIFYVQKFQHTAPKPPSVNRASPEDSRAAPRRPLRCARR